MERLLGLAEPYFAHWGYLILLAATFLENAAFVGTIVPGDVVLLAAGVFAQRGALSLPAVIAVSFAGGLIGDVVGYAAGRFGGRWIARRFGTRLFLPRARLARVEHYFHRYGGRAVLLGRFAPVLRAVRTFVAGMSRMSFLRFLAADAVGAAVWACVVPTLGFAFAESIGVVRRSLGAGGLVALLVLAVLFAISYRAMARVLEAAVLHDPKGREGP